MTSSIKYYKQETNYTCGVACVRMVISAFEDTVPEEWELIPQLETASNAGTHPDMILKVLGNRGYETLTGQDGDLDELNGMIAQGYVVGLAISVDVPHFVIYLGHNNNHAFFHDPWYGERTARELKNFLSPKQRYPFYRWRVVSEEFKKYFPEFNFDDKESNRQWFAFRKISEARTESA